MNFREPRFNDESCADLSIGYEDQVYQFNDGVSCYKIIRTWTVTDLCTYDARNPQAGGVFRRNQTIKVSDIIPPTLIIPNDTVVAVTNDCGSVEVTLPDAFDEDCYTGTTISTDSPFAETRGANASGIYPVGTTEIEFTAVDQCGNVTKRIMTITVEDRTAPEIRCKVNYSVDMEEVNGVIGVTVDAADVVLQATDNCTPFNELTFTIAEAGAVESVPEDLTMNFDCDDLGRKTVEIWSTDSNGNSSLCVTQIGINDDENVCPNNSTSQNGNDAPTPEEEGVIAGGILTEDGNTVEGVMVNVKSDSPFEFETGVDGEYAFYQMAFGKNYVVRPEKDDDVLAGISTLDLVVLAKHIAGTRPFDSPYKWVAGDVDGNGSVSTLDLIRLRKLILNLADNLPNNQKSWRFIDADYVFEDFKNPLSSEYPTQKTIYGLSGDEMHMDFIGVKVGDVNGSATPNSLLNFDRHNVQEPMLISTEDANVSRGSTFEVTLTGAELKEYLGYQFTLDFDPEKMSLLSIELGDLEGLTMENFGLSKIDQGLLMTNWFTPSAVSFNKNQELFTLTFEAYEDFKISEVLRLSSRLARAEAYDVNEQTSNVKLEFKNNGNVTLSENGFNLYQNQPNPFNDQTTIGFDLPAQTEVQFNVFDASGKLLFSNQENYPAGYNTLNIDANQLGTTGLLYYQLKTANFSATKKMVLIK
ncbi:MAG: T9SS type A sorting domain-containing protein [Bacteroidota bacterium]